MLTPEGLNNISQSKYHGSAYTTVDNIFNYLFWEPGVKMLPLWMAPNLITFLGSMCMLAIGVLTLSYNNVTLTAEIPLFVWPLAILALHMYDCLDNMDGKQARRTGTSSPLGQLLDHGFDSSINTNMICFLLVQALHVTNPLYVAMMLVAMEATYTVASWEEHYVGMCRTSVANLGVTEFAILVRIIFFLTWWNGYAFWDVPVYGSISRSDCFVFFTVGIFCWVAPTMIAIVINHTKSLKPLKDLLPLFTICAVLTFFHSNGTLKYYRMPIMLSTASVLGEVTTSIIVCTMAKMPFPMMHKGLFLYVLTAAITVVKGHHNLGKWAYAVVVMVQVVNQLAFSVSTARQIADHLKINIFSIKPKKT